MRKIILLTSLSAMFLPPVSAQTHNQVDVGFVDLAGIDNRFLGARYRYYTTDLDTLLGPHAIKSHLNQVTNFSVGGFKNNDIKYINADVIYYGPQGLLLNTRLQHISDDGGYWRTRDYLLSSSIGKQINDSLQLGVSMFYSKEEQRSTETNTNPYTEVNWKYAPYIRYTDIVNNRGWDLELKQVSGARRNIEGRANYFINQAWSVGLSANIRSDDNVSDNYELQTHYWFTANIAIKFGLGSAFDASSTLNSASLLLTGRF